MKLKHVSIVAREADALADFYRTVFGCHDLRPPTILSGEAISRGNGVANSEIYSIWLGLPGGAGPFLEILEYSQTLD